MRKAAFQKVISPLLADIICDRCGETCVTGSHVSDGVKQLHTSYGTFSADWGYDAFYEDEHGEKVYLDGDTWSAELCAQCSKYIYNLINSGEGPGTEDSFHLGDLTQYGKQGAIRKLERLCQEYLGISSLEFLSYVEKGEVPNNIPAASLTVPLHFAKFYLTYKDIPEEEWHKVEESYGR